MKQSVKQWLASIIFSLLLTSASLVQAQHPMGNEAGLGLWDIGPQPHLVIRPPAGRGMHSVGHATIPYSAKTQVWKPPYAYGYFGASARRHPYRSFGHQQAFTEWRFR